MKILVVDDSKTSLLITESALKNLGHTVISTSSPKDAIKLFQSENPDLIILDVVMDEMSGYDCARAMRASEAEDAWVPIIFLSGRVDDESIQEGVASGGDDYLTKPFSEITLKAKLTAMERISNMRHELVDAKEMLQALSSTDNLTDIPNRREFESILKSSLSLANRKNQSLALLMLDLDHFKNVNDTYGHDAGDELLIQATQRMHDALRESDFIARLGGDEFAIVMIDLEDLLAPGIVAKKIIDLLSEPFQLKQAEVQIGASIGIACYPAAGKDLTEIVKNSDIALYRAKDAGRNNYQYFSDELQKEHSERIKLEQSLKKSIENHDFKLVYQPKFELSSNKCVGFEALIRWPQADGTLISPDTFIPVAEENGSIIALGRWVIDQACKEFSEILSGEGENLVLAINISPHQLFKDDVVSFIKDTLPIYKLSPAQIELEITETAIMAYTEESEKALKDLHEMGIQLSIDDFGTGYSSLTHLKRLPIDALKIDKSFVIDILEDEEDASIVKAVINLGEALNLKVIAEGIESDRHCQFLIENHCEIGQGFGLAKPMPIEELKAFLKE